MSFKSKIKIENLGMFTALAFYAIAGIICFIVLPSAYFPPHIAIIGILSLLAAYGLFKKRVWAIWLVVMLFFIVTTFSAYMLIYFFGKDLILDISMIAYLILTWFFTFYIAAKRKVLTG
ncbi:MAG: hypothetical protein QW667_00460 [Candidatus Bathyarchaeia archaeon]